MKKRWKNIVSKRSEIQKERERNGEILLVPLHWPNCNEQRKLTGTEHLLQMGMLSYKIKQQTRNRQAFKEKHHERQVPNPTNTSMNAQGYSY